MTKFTYHLGERNKQYLISPISDVTEKPYEEIARYIVEIENDNDPNEPITTIKRKQCRLGSA